MNTHFKNDKPLICITEVDDSWDNYPEKEAFLKFISPYGGQMLDPARMSVVVQALPFYKDVNLIRVTIPNDPEWGYVFFLEYGYDYVQLSGSFEAIAELNSRDLLILDDKTVYDYLKFVCFFTNNKEGLNSCVIEGQKSEYLAARSPYDQSRFLRHYSGPEVLKNEKTSHYIISTRIWSGEGVHDAVYRVNYDGKVDRQSCDYVGNV